MSQVLLVVLGVYLTACYAYGVYLLVRVATSKTLIRPTSRREPTELARAARQEIAPEVFEDEQRVAA